MKKERKGRREEGREEGAAIPKISIPNLILVTLTKQRIMKHIYK